MPSSNQATGYSTARGLAIGCSASRTSIDRLSTMQTIINMADRRLVHDRERMKGRQIHRSTRSTVQRVDDSQNVKVHVVIIFMIIIVIQR